MRFFAGSGFRLLLSFLCAFFPPPPPLCQLIFGGPTREKENLYTPLSGSWLNMAESVQRIIVSRALSGQHPKTAKEIIE